jgi:hypothetical protein
MTKPKPTDDAGLFGGSAAESLPSSPSPGSPVEASAEPAGKPGKAVAVRKGGKGAVAPAAASAPPQAHPDAGALALLQTVERLSTNKDTNPAIVEMLLKEMRDLRAEQARSTFDVQMALMQQRLPVAPRKGKIEVRAKDAKGDRTGSITQSTPYAKWEDVVELITPVLGEHGFSLQFKTGLTEKGLVRVVGILAGHGHRETSEIELQHDSTGSKNSVQAVASSISYGKRHVAGALLNLVSRGEDDDGASTGRALVLGDPITVAQADQIIDLQEAVECPRDKFLEHLNKTRPKNHPEIDKLADLPATRFDEAIAALRSFEANRKARAEAAKKPAQQGAQT